MTSNRASYSWLLLVREIQSLFLKILNALPSRPIKVLRNLAPYLLLNTQRFMMLYNKPILVSSLLLLTGSITTACNHSVQKSDNTTVTNTPEECSPLEATPLDTTDIKIKCPLGSDDTNLLFEDQQSWDLWLESCYGEVSAPTIDFDTHDVIGGTVGLNCPFAGTPELMGTLSCGSELLTSVWTWPDYCFCDYFDTYLILYAVEKGTSSALSIDLIFETTCEETICGCDDGSTIEACDLTQFCPVTDSYTVEVDGLPPEWP